jgi:hypothetical protein
MPDVKANAILPKGEANGLAAIADELLKDPTRKRAALIIFDLRRGTEDYDVSDIVATVRIRRVEPLLPDDLPNAELMIRRAAQARTIGGEQLAFEFEQEIEAAFEAMRDPTSPADPDEPGPGEGTIDPPPGDPPDDGEPGKGPRGGRGRK